MKYGHGRHGWVIKTEEWLRLVEVGNKFQLESIRENHGSRGETGPIWLAGWLAGWRKDNFQFGCFHGELVFRRLKYPKSFPSKQAIRQF